jgi:hypothetical protein
VSCAKRSDPSWATIPASKISGDGTVTGEPAPVAKLGGAITMDGKLDEAAWSNATALGPFVQPGNGAESNGSPADGFARVAWDDTKLYFGFVVRDRSPFSPFTQEDKDPHIWEKSSAIEIMLQPGDPGDNRDYYEIQVDVHGAVFDTHWDDYNTPITGSGDSKSFGHMDWSGQIERAIYVANDAYYSVEMAIPWSALVKGRTAIPPKAGDVWRLDLYTFRDGQSIALAWSPIRGQGNFHKSSRFGRIKLQ